MPKGPRGERRPTDVVGAAIKVAKIARGEIDEGSPEKHGKAYARKGGLKCGKVRATRLTAEQRSEIARLAAEAR